MVQKPCCSSGEYKGYQYITSHNHVGFRLGYVRIPKDHPWYGKGWDDEELEDVKVHYGLTYYSSDHPLELPQVDNERWIGFDCAHFCDAPDESLMSECSRPSKRLWDKLGGTVRTLEFVEAECRSVCEQAQLAEYQQAKAA